MIKENEQKYIFWKAYLNVVYPVILENFLFRSLVFCL